MKIAFESSARSSLGVEWELELVDPATRQLTSGASEILEAMSPGTEHPKAKHELLESTIEVITGVCTTVSEATAPGRHRRAGARGGRAARVVADVLGNPSDHRLADAEDQP